MTREEREIIEAIKSMGYDRTAHPREKVSAVISMAIEALQAEPTNGRPIDAEALYASIAKDTYLLTDRINSRDYGMFLIGIKEKIDNAPTVQAARPTGEWIKDGQFWTCSECGTRIFSESYMDRQIYHAFCSRCGVRMEK